MAGVPEGICPRCGIRYEGWALLNPIYQTCPSCGVNLEIRNGEGELVLKATTQPDVIK
jgi:hypothetical protein